MTVHYEEIEAAARILNGAVVRTPCLQSRALSRLTGADITVKFENLQDTASFKDRGAYVKLHALDRNSRKNGVIAMSAGNHAQSVALHAKRLAIPAVIVMPEHTPFTKVERTQGHGARVVLSGATLVETQKTMEKLAREENLTIVHPYDDDMVIAGQGTIALEMLEDAPDLEILVIPVGGGGLISGCAIAARKIRPDITIIGVEAKSYPAMYHSLKGGEAVCGGATLAEGIAVKNVADRTVQYCSDLVDDIVLIDEAQIEQAVHLMLARQKTLAEGAGAIGLAAVLADRNRFAGRKTGLIITGGNIDPRILASISYRELERERRIVRLRINIDDRPGMLGEVSTILGRHGANILEVSHHRMYLDIPAKGARLDLMIETRNGAHADELAGRLRKAGFDLEFRPMLSQDN